MHLARRGPACGDWWGAEVEAGSFGFGGDTCYIYTTTCYLCTYLNDLDREYMYGVRRHMHVKI